MAAVGIRSEEDDPSANQKDQSSFKTENVFKVVNVLMSKKLAPLIIFSFRKKECEKYARAMSKLNFNTEIEQKLVDEVFNNAIDILSETEKQLPQITKILPLLRKGIAFHHSGLLPLIKETVEILFGEGLIKALFATETFAMGLNMPAKTVIFTSIKKFDGVNDRIVSSGEYIQMSGRAGRRGLDTNGLVVLMIDEKISYSQVSDIIQGKADPLNSAFHLTDNMILNLMRQEEINPEYMIEKSFLIFQTRSRLLELRKSLKAKQLKYSKIHIEDEESIAAYTEIVGHLENLHEELKMHMINPQYILPFLHEGRLVKLKQNDIEYDWGVVTGIQRLKSKQRNDNKSNINIHVMLSVQGEQRDDSLPKPAFNKNKGRVGSFTVNYKSILQISSEVVQLIGKNNKERTRWFWKVINKMKQNYPQGLPLLHPINDMGIDTPGVVDLLDKLNYFENMLERNQIRRAKKEKFIKYYHQKQVLEKELNEMTEEMEQLISLLKMDELLYRKNVLRKLGYCNEADVINMKGRVACELNCVDELLLTEMIFNGVFTDLSVDYCVALLSCFVSKEFESETDHDVILYKSLKLVKEIASGIGNISVECNLIKNKEDYTEKCFQWNLVKIVLAWCQGASFLDICKMTPIYEGSIIRYLRMLEEVLRQLCKAATNVGNTDLENRFSEGIRILKRGVVFAGSLYL